MFPRLILAGGSGFLGQTLACHFSERGWAVTVLTRSSQAPLRGIRYARWDGETLGDWAKELEGAAAVVNLAGRSVDCRYTAGTGARSWNRGSNRRESSVRPLPVASIRRAYG